VLSLVAVLAGSIALADDRYEPGDPIAAVDGDPIYFGELNLVLAERLAPEKLKQVGIEVQKATALLLVRRHLAMKSLQKSGTEALESTIAQRLAALTGELKRRGSSLSEHAGARKADEKSLVADLSWKVAWGQYVTSNLHEKNLRRYFEQHPDSYTGSFDDLTDQSKLRREATSALFNTLVRRQKNSKIQWFITALRPPGEVPIIP
jgi:hypothetical protein